MYDLKRIVRNWTTNRLQEREPTFSCIFNIVGGSGTPAPQVLVPEAAPGRLAHEISNMGNVEVISNEWSATMDLAYRWLTSLKPNSRTII